MASLIAAKGLDVLIRAYATLDLNTDDRLVIVGEGPEKEKLLELASELNIAGHVEFLGLRDDVSDILRETDIFVHPCRWAEAFGFAIAEAMAAGLPTVASDIGAVRELVLEGLTGYLVEPDSPEALSKALAALMSDASARMRMGECARQAALDKFSVSRSVLQHLDVCENALAG